MKLKAKLATSISSKLRHLPFDVVAVNVSYGIGIIKILKCQQILINPLHIKDKSIPECANVIQLLLQFEKIRLTIC